MSPPPHRAVFVSCIAAMRTTDLALAFLAVRSRLTWLGRRKGVHGTIRAGERSHILIVDPASDVYQTLLRMRLLSASQVLAHVVKSNPRLTYHLFRAGNVASWQELETTGYQVTAAHDLSDTELEQILPAFDAVVVRSANRVTRSMLVASPRVAVVGRAGSGVDNIDLKAALELGVPVVNAPTGNAGSVAELVVGLMLGVSRKISPAHDTTRRGEWAKSRFTGRTLNGKTLGIIGFGSVGIALARLAMAFGMVVMIGEGPSPSPASGGANGADPSASKRAAVAREVGVTLPPVGLDELLSKSDFLSLHCPLTADTKGLISERELALMKPSAVVINTARGGVVDEKALLRSLEQGRLGGAALDVFECERSPLQNHVISLCRLPNVLCTPHIGGSTEEAGGRVLAEVCRSVTEFLEGTLQPSKIVNGAPDTALRLARLNNSS